MSVSWGNEQWLWALAVPALFWVGTFIRRRQSRKVSSAESAPKAVARFNNVSLSHKSLARTGYTFFSLSLALLVVSAAQPRWGKGKVVNFERSREVIIALDLSKSMLAEDIKPNRLQRAKLVIESMLDTLEGESVGLIAFAGTAFLQSPMSPDYQILRSFLDEMNPDYIPQGGTNFEVMLQTAQESFEQSDGMADRFLIVISDGESLNDNWLDEAESLQEQNVQAICLGFGTPEGSFIPDGSGGYLKDPQGAVVLSKLEPQTLQQLASVTNGVYRVANVWIDLAELIESTVKQGEANLVEREASIEEKERFQYFLAPAVALLMLSLYREFPSAPKPRNLKKGAAA